MLLLFPSWLRLCLLFRLLPSVEFLPVAAPHGHDLRFLLFSFFPPRSHYYGFSIRLFREPPVTVTLP